MKVISLINGVPVDKVTHDELEVFRKKSLEKALDTIGFKLVLNTNIKY